MNDKLITIKENEEYTEIILGSKFIAQTFHINDETEAKNIIAKVKEKYSDATHNCYAYKCMAVERFSDDKEPAKTAGYPILEAIKYSGLTNIVVIVTRYFGGTLLGTGGLIRAYGKLAKKVIEKAEKYEYVKGEEILIKLDYSNIENFENFLKINQINIVKKEYKEEILLKIEVSNEKKLELEKNLEKIFLKKIEEIVKEEKYKIIESKYIINKRENV